MAEIIIEEVTYDPFEFLYEIFKRGDKMDISLVKNQLVDDEDFQFSCLVEGNFEFYKWACVNIGFQEHVYKMLYSLGPLGFIPFTEEVIPTLPDSSVTRVTLEHFCLIAELDFPSGDIDEYARWLMRIGRATSLSPKTIRSLVYQLLLDDSEVLPEFLLAINAIHPGNAKFVIGELIGFAESEDHDFGMDLLMRMARAGIFSTPHGRECLLNNVKLSREDVDLIWRESLNTDNSELKLFLGLLSRTEIFRTPIDELLRVCTALSCDKMKYGACIFNVIILNYCCSEDEMHDPYQTIASKIILESLFIPVLWEEGVDPDIVWSLSRKVLIRGGSWWITKYHEKMYASSNREIYIKAANTIIHDQQNGSHLEPPRVVEIMKLLGPDADVSIYLKPYVPHLSGPITEYLLKKIVDEELAGYSDLADDLLSRTCQEHEESGSVFLNNNHLIGRKTLATLMFTIWNYDEGHPTWPHLLRRVTRYMDSHKSEYITGIVTRFLYHKPLHAALALHTEFRGLIHKTYDHLILGSHKYAAQGHSLIDVANNLEIPNTNCTKCRCVLAKKIYLNPSDSHGKYTCLKCAAKNSSEVTCLICLSSEHDMRVLACGHCVCKDCIQNTVIKHDKKCPLCKKNITAMGTLTVMQVVSKFFAEWNKNKGQTRQRSLKLWRESSVDDRSEYSESE